MGDPLRIDWQLYYEAAKKCHDLATELRIADKPVHDAVKGECAGMAGDAPGCKEWGKAYDRSAQETMQACTNLADALTNFGYVLYAAGYNYGLNARADPPPPRPQVHEMTEHKVDIPTSVRDNGLGIDHGGGVQELFDALIARIINEFGKLPNGDVDSLAKAALVWQGFAAHETITGAAGKVSAIVGLFDTVQDRTNLQPILDHLETLGGSAAQLATATQNLATPVGAYHTGMVEVRGEIDRTITSTEWAIGITVVAGAAAAFFSWGASAAAAGGGVTVMVGNCINAIRTAYQASRLFRVLGLATAAAGAVGTIKAFDGVPDLGSTLTSLGAIIAMKVLIDDDGVLGPGEAVPEIAPNKDVTGEMARMLAEGINPGEDCSEIAEKLKRTAGEVGEILKIEPAPGQELTVEEYGIPEEFLYHEVYTDGKYVYDPRHSPEPIPIEQWRRTMLGDNPGATIEPVG
ncbi:hypothetical protein ABZV91_31825 [Nocardia sp. NPDC004568]|uniref:hypothetical protein n=1 Tax=Nocardia sp. NPDC004568 TaxID=3154551 RepID=UPI0033B32B17